MPPLVSILMPVFNSREFVGETIESVLRQTFSDFLFFIYNDGSSDGTEKEILRFKDDRIKYFSLSQNVGYVKVLNMGLQNINTPFIARIDSDDVCEIRRLEKQISLLQRNPEIGICGSAARLIESGEEMPTRIWSQPEKHEEILFKGLTENPIIHPSVMFRKTLVEKIGYYNTNLMPSEDLDYWLRASSHFKLYNIPEPLIKYRIHNKQISNTSNNLQAKNANAIHLHFISRSLKCENEFATIIFKKLLEHKRLNFSERFILLKKLLFSQLPQKTKKQLIKKLL